MRRKLIITCLLVLTVFVGSVVAQRIRKHGGLLDVTSAGAITITSRSGQAITLTGTTAHVGASTFSSTVGITGNVAVNTNKFTVAASSGNTLIAGTLTTGTGNALAGLAKYSASLSPAEVAANTCAEQTFTVTGVTTSDVVFVNKPTAQAGLGIAGVRASATNQVGINFCNATAAPITPTASQTYVFGVMR